MKQVITFIAILLISAQAYTQGIEFFHGTWEEALTEAKKQGKTIFVDAYTTWCGPCKRMSKNVFPDPGVGEFYNANFINMKLDMERGEGLKFRQKYPVTAFPTFYFIAPDGEIVYTTKGARQIEGFIELGKTALSKYDGSKQYEEAYAEGDRSYDLMINYVRELNNAGKPSLKIANEYLNSDPDITEEQRLLFIAEAATQVDSRIFTILESHSAEIIELVGQENWNTCIRTAAINTAERAKEYESPSLIDQAAEVMAKYLPEETDQFRQRSYMNYALAYRQSEIYGEYAKPYVKKTVEDDDKALIKVTTEVISYFPNDKNLIDIAEKAVDRAMHINESIEAYIAYVSVHLRKGEKEEALEKLGRGIRFAEENKLSDKNLQALKRMIENS